MSQRKRQRSGSLTGQRLLDGDNEEGRTAEGFMSGGASSAGSVRVFPVDRPHCLPSFEICLQDSLSTQLNKLTRMYAQVPHFHNQSASQKSVPSVRQDVASCRSY